MKKLSKYFVAMGLLIFACNVVTANTGTAYVATVNGDSAFGISNGGSQLLYDVQPDTDYNWYYEDGSVVTYTSGGVTADRDGMKTFAATNVAYGTRLSDISLFFQYASSSFTDSSGYGYGNYPTINIHITDGNGNYAIWSATSGGTGFTTTTTGGLWESLTLDCTSFADNSTFGKINESTNTSVLANGNLSSTKAWDTIKNWTVAGFYDEQFSPTGGWDAWGQTLWGDINSAGDVTPVNQYGISLVWGDTVGSMNGDYDSSYVGALAERSYGQKVKLIDSFVVTAAGTSYDIVFVADTCAAVVPAPGAILLAGLGTACLGRIRRHLH